MNAYRFTLAGFFLSGLAAACAAPSAPGVDATTGAIVDGRFGGDSSVVFLYRLDGAACTGAIIAPRVVLTANHCVEASSGSTAPARNFRVYVGNSTRGITAEYLVSEVRPVPGAGLGAGQSNDVALLILSQSARETPLQISTADPRSLFGETCTAVGYGQTPAGGSGTKYTVETRVEGVQSGFIFVPPTVCSGDSGGPLLGPDNLIYGVASFIYSPDGSTAPRCGTAPGAYNGISQHLDFITSVLEETGSCVPSDEVCDGADNDCDEMTDEGCTPLGAACTTNSECTGGFCRDTPRGSICASACDPLRPSQGCSPGFYCAADGCEGYCLEGAPGELPLEADCADDTECFSLFCVDPGDGRSRCLEPCQGGAGLCLAGEVCAAPSGACGGCVPAELVLGRRQLGEPCAADDECQENLVCRDIAGVSECASGCAGVEENECPDGFLCRENHCIRDRTRGVGGVCDSNADCGEMGICAAQSGRNWCTATCGGASDCPSGFDCVDAGGIQVCAPMAGLTGESCTVSEDCASNTCASIGGEGSVCTTFCDARTACAPGFECVRADGMGAAVCLEASADEPEGGGCAVGPAVSRAPGWLLLGVVGVSLLAARRRLG